MSARIQFRGLDLGLFATGSTLPRPTPADPRIHQYMPLARSMARRFLPRMAGQLDIDDLTSIAMVAIWKATTEHDVSRGASFGSYATLRVLHALHQTQLRIWRTSRRAWLRQAAIHAEGDEPPGVMLAAPAPSALHQLLDAETAALIRQAVAGLPARQRLVIERLYLEELPTAEAAESISRTRQAVHLMHVKALQTLASRLRKGGA